MNSSFAYSKVVNSPLFVQPTLASSIASQINNVNKPALSKIVTSEAVRVRNQDIAKGTTLSSLLETGARDPSTSQDVLEVFMKEIGNQNE